MAIMAPPDPAVPGAPRPEPSPSSKRLTREPSEPRPHPGSPSLPWTITPSDPGENRWRACAACASGDDHSDYHDSRRRHPRCDTCPASEPCLWFGLANEKDAGYRYGCWGGTTPARRARIAAGLGDGDYRQWYRQLATSWHPPAPHVREAS